MTKFKLMPIGYCTSIVYRRDGESIPCKYLESFYEHYHTDGNSSLVWKWKDKDKLETHFFINLMGFCCHCDSLKSKLTEKVQPRLKPFVLDIDKGVETLWNTCAAITDEDSESDFPAWCPLQDYDDGEE